MFAERHCKGQIAAYRISFVVMLAVLIVITGCESQDVTSEHGQRVFKSPESAVAALVDAVRANDVNALQAIFGPESNDLISSGDEVDDIRGRGLFVKAYEATHRLEKIGDNKVILYIGKEDWPMPIPIVKAGKRWHFQTEEGREELLSRRIGKNELSTIQTCLAVYDAEKEYAALDCDNDAILEYAQKLESGQGEKDGLYWEAEPGEPLSPLGPLVARAVSEGYEEPEQMAPYHGYYFRILTAQGEGAKGGAYSYIVNGNMIGGFAIVAYPALYRSSGVKTFIVNHEGVAYEKDLGPETATLAAAMTDYNPDDSWKRAKVD